MGDARIDLTVALFVAAMAICAWLGLRHRVGIILLALLSLIWLTVDKLWEGPHLFSLTPRHGVVAADVVGVVGLLSALGLVVVRIARHNRRP